MLFRSQRLAELLEVLDAGFRARLLRLQVAAAKDLVRIAETAALEPDANCRPNDMRGRLPVEILLLFGRKTQGGRKS